MITIKKDYEYNKFNIGIVISEWNSFVTTLLLEGAVEVLKSKGYNEDQIITVYCPGAYEIPFSAKKLLPKVDGIITLGAVIRGETPHFDYVCMAVNRGVMELNLNSEKPVSFGVLTTNNVSQARERASSGGKKGNKGAEAALALLDMLSIGRKIENL